MCAFNSQSSASSRAQPQYVCVRVCVNTVCVFASVRYGVCSLQRTSFDFKTCHTLFKITYIAAGEHVCLMKAKHLSGNQ